MALLELIRIGILGLYMIFALIGAIVYIAVGSKDSKWGIAINYLISLVVAVVRAHHLWKYHHNGHTFEKKLFALGWWICVMLAFYITALVLWAFNLPSEAAPVTFSWILSMLQLGDIYISA